MCHLLGCVADLTALQSELQNEPSAFRPQLRVPSYLFASITASPDQLVALGALGNTSFLSLFSVVWLA